jgi:hypothetical protein
MLMLVRGSEGRSSDVALLTPQVFAVADPEC